MKAIILAAGIGSRLGKSFPKPLTLLENGCSILHNQIKNLTRYIDVDDIFIVVGFKKDLIMEAFPYLTFIYNDFFDTTNTSKSLLRGLKKVKNEDAVWLNGDVVFDHKVIGRLLQQDLSCVAVNKAKVGDEEIKYTISDDGSIKKISKVIKDSLGEALGINFLKRSDHELLKKCLDNCKDDDYFERAIELAIEQGLKIYPLDISDLDCVEVDFTDDLNKANSFFK